VQDINAVAASDGEYAALDVIHMAVAESSLQDIEPNSDTPAA